MKAFWAVPSITISRATAANTCTAEAPSGCYTIYRYERARRGCTWCFAIIASPTMIGFVYSGMPAQDAANHLIRNIKESAQPVLDAGKDAVVSIILDGENAWEYYPQSGREFLRRFYDALQRDPQIEPVTISEAIRATRKQISAAWSEWCRVRRSTPISMYGSALPKTTAPGTCSRKPATTTIGMRTGCPRTAQAGLGRAADRRGQRLELVVRAGTSLGQRQGFRRAIPQASVERLSRAGRRPARRIEHAASSAASPGQATSHRPRMCARVWTDVVSGYFEWMGAASYTSDQRTSAMHGKQFLLDAVYAGVDADFCRAVSISRQHPRGRLPGGGEPGGTTRRQRSQVTGGFVSLAGGRAGPGGAGLDADQRRRTAKNSPALPPTTETEHQRARGCACRKSSNARAL